MCGAYNVSFCKDITKAKERLRSASTTSSNDHVGDLLVAFFYYYGYTFPFATNVISIKSEKTTLLKVNRWCKKDVQLWRMSIEDPFETNRDLGIVLRIEEQIRIVEEFKRAYTLLLKNSPFSKVCIEEKQVLPKKQKEQSKQKEQTKPRTLIEKETTKTNSPAQKRKSEEMFSCSTCQLLHLSEHDYELHIQGVKHLSKVASSSVKK